MTVAESFFHPQNDKLNIVLELFQQDFQHLFQQYQSFVISIHPYI